MGLSSPTGDDENHTQYLIFAALDLSFFLKSNCLMIAFCILQWKSDITQLQFTVWLSNLTQGQLIHVYSYYAI